MKPHTWKLLGGSARVKRLLGRAMSQTQQASRFNGELHAVLIASGACSVANKESALRRLHKANLCCRLIHAASTIRVCGRPDAGARVDNEHIKSRLHAHPAVREHL